MYNSTRVGNGLGHIPTWARPEIFFRLQARLRLEFFLKNLGLSSNPSPTWIQSSLTIITYFDQKLDWPEPTIKSAFSLPLIEIPSNFMNSKLATIKHNKKINLLCWDLKFCIRWAKTVLDPFKTYIVVHHNIRNLQWKCVVVTIYYTYLPI